MSSSYLVVGDDYSAAFLALLLSKVGPVKLMHTVDFNSRSPLVVGRVDFFAESYGLNFNAFPAGQLAGQLDHIDGWSQLLKKGRRDLIAPVSGNKGAASDKTKGSYQGKQVRKRAPMLAGFVSQLYEETEICCIEAEELLPLLRDEVEYKQQTTAAAGRALTDSEAADVIIFTGSVATRQLERPGYSDIPAREIVRRVKFDLTKLPRKLDDLLVTEELALFPLADDRYRAQFESQSDGNQLTQCGELLGALHSFYELIPGLYEAEVKPLPLEFVYYWGDSYSGSLRYLNNEAQEGFFEKNGVYVGFWGTNGIGLKKIDETF